MVWQVLPHRAAAVIPAATSGHSVRGAGTLGLSNATGAIAGRVDVFSLLGTSGKVPPPLLPDPGDNFAVVDLRAVGARLVGIGGGSFAVQFAVNTFGARAHPNYPAESTSTSITTATGRSTSSCSISKTPALARPGQNVTAVFNLVTGTAAVFFFTDADLDSANAILTAPLSALGLTPGTQFDLSIFGCDNYFTGACTDAIEGMTYTLGDAAHLSARGSGHRRAGRRQQHIDDQCRARRRRRVAVAEGAAPHAPGQQHGTGGELDPGGLLTRGGTCSPFAVVTV